MNKNDWYETGEQIRKLVQDAVDSKDFSQLGDTITDVVNQTVDGLQSVLKETLGSRSSAHWDQDAKQGADGRNQDVSHRGADWYQKTNREAAERIRRNMQQKEIKKRKQSEQLHQNRAHPNHREYKPVKKPLKVPGEISGQVMKWSGYSMSSMFGLALAIIGVIGVTTGFPVAVPVGILAILFGLSFAIGMSGKRKLGFARRFRRYQEILGERTYCLVEELASAIGQSCKYVQKDLKRMICLGYFKEGYLDRKETLLITDRTTYQQYQTSQTEYEKRSMQESGGTQKKKETDIAQQEKGKLQTSGEQNRKLTPECKELVEEGKRYICHVHECNVKIEDEEMSSKLDRLELVITRIFREAEKNAEVVPDLKKMMSYYLPTTQKLLDAYCELDEQPIHGQNIQNTKKEIEAALDTINKAFEKLLDDLFEDTAWDISTDISVLQTMLAQEGLTGGNDFR